MYSSEDLERFYFQYQMEAIPKCISIEHTVHIIKFLITNYPLIKWNR